MSTCTVRKGIFVIRECGSQATQTCSACSRPICAAHSQYSGTGMICVECKAVQDAQAGRATQDYGSPEWPYTYRQGFYNTAFFTPLILSGFLGSAFDQHDFRSFDRKASPQDYDDEDYKKGFVDS
jgi:hypothetical protein